MGSLRNDYPPIRDGDPSEVGCTHEWVQPSHGEGYYMPSEHLFVELFGGRPGYAAAALPEAPTASADLWRQWDSLLDDAFAAGWRRCAIGHCGYGEPADADEVERAEGDLALALARRGKIAYELRERS